MSDVLHIYCRVSTDQQELHGHSLDFQKDLGIKKSEELGFDYEIHDEGSASSSPDDLDNRPVLSELMSKVRSGEVHHLFVYEYSRLSRSSIVSSILNRDFKEHGVTVHLQVGQYDLSSPIDEMVSTILQSVSRYERQTTLNRSRLGLRKAYEKGKITGQVPSLGYKKDDEGYMVIDEDEKELYLRIIDWTLIGENPYEIARRLNSEGIPTKNSKYRPNGVRFRNRQTGEVKVKNGSDFIWRSQTINHILSNPVYYGHRLYKGDLLPHDHPIITKSKWDEVQRSIQKRVEKSLNRSGGRSKRFYLLLGLLTCRKCGSNLCGRWKTDEQTYYCGKKRKENRELGDGPCELRSINIGVLDELVWDTLVEVLSNSHLRKEEVKKRLLGEKGRDPRKKELESQIRGSTQGIEEQEVKKERLLTLYLDNRLDKDRFTSQDQSLSTKLDTLTRDRDSLQSQLDLISGDHWIDWLKSFENEVEGIRGISDPKERQKVIREYVDRVTINSQSRTHSIEIHLKYRFVGEKLVYRDPTDKRKGYDIVPGGRYITRKTSPSQRKSSKRGSTNHHIEQNIRCGHGRWRSHPSTRGDLVGPSRCFVS